MKGDVGGKERRGPENRQFVTQKKDLRGDYRLERNEGVHLYQ